MAARRRQQAEDPALMPALIGPFHQQVVRVAVPVLEPGIVIFTHYLHGGPPAFPTLPFEALPDGGGGLVIIEHEAAPTPPELRIAAEPAPAPTPDPAN
jgi:hypothetical protein